MSLGEDRNNLTWYTPQPVLPMASEPLGAPIPPPINFDINPADFTLQLVCSIKEDCPLNGDINLAYWNSYIGSTWNYRAMIQLSSRGGFAFRILAPANLQIGRKHEFVYQLYTGSLVEYKGQNLFVTIGLSTDRHEGYIIVRNMAGEVLARDVYSFVIGNGLSKNFLSSYPPEMYQVEEDICWSDAGVTLPQGNFNPISFGHEMLDVYSWDIAPYNPSINRLIQSPFEESASGNLLSLDGAHPTLQYRPITRELGYGHYTTQRVKQTINEGYVPLAPAFRWRGAVEGLSRGLYTLTLYGNTQEAAPYPRYWPLTRMKVRVIQNRVDVINDVKIVKWGNSPRAMMAWDFELTDDSMVALEIENQSNRTIDLVGITLRNHEIEVPPAQIKSKQRMVTGPKLEPISVDEGTRRELDRHIWNALPPLNQMLQVHGTPYEWVEYSSDAGDWWLQGWTTTDSEGDLVRESWWHSKAKPYVPQVAIRLSDGVTAGPDILMRPGNKWADPYGDDGNGVQFPDSSYYFRRAWIMGNKRLIWFIESIVNRANQYLATGNSDLAHDAAMALVRLSSVFPSYDLTFLEPRLSITFDDPEYHTDWSFRGGRNGKWYYAGWMGEEFNKLCLAYDILFPYIKDSQMLASSVQRFMPFVETPRDVLGLLDSRLVLTGLRDSLRGLIRGDVGDAVYQVLGPHEKTLHLIDYRVAPWEVYPYIGSVLEMYGTAFTSDGASWLGSEFYNSGNACSLINKAWLTYEAMQEGMEVPVTLHFRKVLEAARWLYSRAVPGGHYRFMYGDSSGGTHDKFVYTPQDLFREGDAEAIEKAKTVFGDSAHLPNPYHPEWRYLRGIGFAANCASSVAVVLRTGTGKGHSHSDALDLQIFAGEPRLPMSVDIAQRNEASNWTRPHAGWTFMHNRAMAVYSDDPSVAQRSNESELFHLSDDTIIARNRDENDVLTRVVLTGPGYTPWVFDYQHVKALKDNPTHVWSWHGCESQTVQARRNESILSLESAEEHPWLTRTLENTRKRLVVGPDTYNLMLRYVMTRQEDEYVYSFDGGGKITTVAAEQHILGELYGDDVPSAYIEARMLAEQNDEFLCGHGYSSRYQYCFPFSWVRRAGTQETSWPCVYEHGRSEAWHESSLSTLNRVAITFPGCTEQFEVIHKTGESETIGLGFNSQGTPYANVIRVLRDNGLARLSVLGSSCSLPEIDVAFLAPKLVNLLHFDPTNSVLELDTDNLSTRPFIAFWDPGTGRTVSMELERVAPNKFAYSGDRTVRIARITGLSKLAEDTYRVELNLPIFGAEQPGRQPSAFTTTTQDGVWSDTHSDEPLVFTRVDEGPLPKIGDYCTTWELTKRFKGIVHPKLVLEKTWSPENAHYRVTSTVPTALSIRDTVYSLAPDVTQEIILQDELVL